MTLAELMAEGYTNGRLIGISSWEWRGVPPCISLSPLGQTRGNVRNAHDSNSSWSTIARDLPRHRQAVLVVSQPSPQRRIGQRTGSARGERTRLARLDDLVRR